MKVYNLAFTDPLLPELKNYLTAYRLKRKFNAENYLEAKAMVLNNYMKKCGLKSCVVAVSGGIDSAVVLGIVSYASKMPHSPIEKIVPLMLPVFDKIAATNQKEATEKGEEVATHFGITPLVIDVSPIHDTVKQNVDHALGIRGEGWASGQLVAQSRTPTIYYTTSLLTQMGLPGIICGTTNKDEGAYLGYFGKASDGLVDVQLISDLHKSEVYSLARILRIPEKILSAEPNGDMYDGRSDESVFGASYDFVEMYHEYLREDKEWVKSLSQHAREQFLFLQKNVENLHNYNAHKYVSASPAVHLDILESSVPNGWKNNSNWSSPEQVDESKFVNQQFISFLKEKSQPKLINNFTIKNLLTLKEVEGINKQIKDLPCTPVAPSGYLKDFTGTLGSLRLSVYDKSFADHLWSKIKGEFTFIKENGRIFKPVGVASLFRFIKYPPGGELLPHYDHPFTMGTKQTKLSVVIYLTSGETRFIKENDLKEDWTSQAGESEVKEVFSCQSGDALVFPHDVLHDSKKIEGSEKIVIRTDIVFEEIT